MCASWKQRHKNRQIPRREQPAVGLALGGLRSPKPLCAFSLLLLNHRTECLLREHAVPCLARVLRPVSVTTREDHSQHKPDGTVVEAYWLTNFPCSTVGSPFDLSACASERSFASCARVIVSCWRI